jgi:DNA primase
VLDDEVGEFHCFRCGAHGDAVDFVLRSEPLLFEAVLQ